MTLAAAVALDLALGELPTPAHPVAAAGWCLRAGHERLRSAPPPLQVGGGALVTAVTATAAAGLGWGWARTAAALSGGWPGQLLEAAALKPTFALRALIVEAQGVASRLNSGDLPSARRRLQALVSRPTTDLPPGLVASAACESLAENLTELGGRSLVGLSPPRAAGGRGLSGGEHRRRHVRVPGRAGLAGTGSGAGR